MIRPNHTVKALPCRGTTLRRGKGHSAADRGDKDG
jgi:hypothetical protein